jgi:hypothetical protein
MRGVIAEPNPAAKPDWTGYVDGLTKGHERIAIMHAPVRTEPVEARFLHQEKGNPSARS